jgi:hypothetical protein
LFGHRSVFKGDEKKDGAKVNELLIWQLGQAADGSGIEGVWVTEAKTYMDAGSVMLKAKAVRGGKVIKSDLMSGNNNDKKCTDLKAAKG